MRLLLLIIMLFMSCLSIAKEPIELSLYKVDVVRVVDGDTYWVDIDLGFNISLKEKLRLKDYDTPETWRPKTNSERIHGHQATDFVRSLIENKTIYILSNSTGKYGRSEAVVYATYDDYKNNRHLGILLEENGLLKRESYKDGP